MIEATRGYKDSNGVVHGTIEDAQRAELTLLFPVSNDGSVYTPEGIVNTLFKHADEIVAALRPKSRPRKVAVKAVRPGRKGGKKAASEDSGE